MKILVTGGAGYVGSHTVEVLVEEGHDVVVFDDLSLGHKDGVDKKAKLVEGNLLDKKQVLELFSKNKFDAVMHFAAKSLVGESMQKPLFYLGGNVLAAINIFETMGESGVKKFILSSTANLFSSPRKIPISESEEVVPGSPYGESKYIIERMLSWLDKTQGVRYATLRYFNAAGASPKGRIGEDHRPETHLIPNVISTALGQKGKLVVNGNDYDTPDGTCIRDYVHVSDLAQAHILSLEALDKGSRIYNLGSGSGYSNLEVIKTVEEVTGQKVSYEFGPRRPGDPAKLVASYDKIKKELGWSPKHGLKEIIGTAYSWHKAHPEGFKE